jgi:hypothetical protein
MGHPRRGDRFAHHGWSTIYGAFVGFETADEWENATFSRGFICFEMQPFRHLGLRALIEPHDNVDVVHRRRLPVLAARSDHWHRRVVAEPRLVLRVLDWSDRPHRQLILAAGAAVDAEDVGLRT